MIIPHSVTTFIRQHGIETDEVETTLTRVQQKVPDAKLTLDASTLADHGVLRLEIDAGGRDLLPVLFGTTDALTALVKDLWSESAGSWSEEMNSLANRGTFLKREILLPALLEAARVEIKAGARVLDVGCGEGVLLAELDRLDQDAVLFGIDVVEGFIRELRSRWPAWAPRLSIQDVVSFTDLEGFDVVFASALLLVVPDVEAALLALARLVRPGGLLVIGDVNSQDHRCLGYFEDTTLVRVHDPMRVHHFEKMVGGHGGRTRSVHNHHPPGFYRSNLEGAGLRCVEDRLLVASEAAVRTHPRLEASERERLAKQMRVDFRNPPFHLLVMRRPELER